MRVVRVATDADVPGWLALAAEVVDLFGPMPDLETHLRRNIQRGTALVVTDGDALLGACLLSRDDRPHSIDWLSIAATARRSGAGSQLLREVLARWPDADISVTTFAPDLPGGEPARRFYESAGFRSLGETDPAPDGEARELFVLRRPHRHGPHRIRAPAPDDAAVLGRVMVDSWLSAHRGQLPEEAWRKRAAAWTPEVSAQGWARVLADQARGDSPRDVLLVAEDAGRLIGLVYARPVDDEGSGSVAEVSALYVASERHGEGVGRALLRAAAEELRGLTYSTIRLEVLSENRPARGFYEHLGGREVGEGTVDEDGHVLPVTIYEWDVPVNLRGSPSR